MLGVFERDSLSKRYGFGSNFFYVHGVKTGKYLLETVRERTTYLSKSQ